MNRFVLLVLFITFCDTLSAQPSGQTFLLGNYQIREKKSYQIFEKGRSEKDSVLISLTQYNGYGRDTLIRKFDTLGHFRSLQINDYIDNIRISKSTYYSKDTLAGPQTEYFYNNNDKLVKIVGFVQNSKGKSDTVTTLITYDSLQRQIAWSTRSGDKLISSKKYEFDGAGLMIKYELYSYKKNRTTVTEVEYDSRENPVRYYRLNKGKRILTDTYIYNTENQCIEKQSPRQKSIRKHFFNQTYKVRKTDNYSIRYEYDGRGFLIKESRFLNNKLVTQYVFRYF